MWVIYDNITATMIAGTIILLLMAMQLRVTRLSIEQTATYMTKKYSLAFADWLQKDLLKIGRHLNPDDPDCDDDSDDWGCQVLGDLEWEDGRTERFVFYRDSLRDGKVYHMKVKYELKEVDPGAGEDLFRAVRSVKLWRDGTPEPVGWVRTGSSPGLLRHFEIRMLDENGEVVSDPADNMDDVEQTSVKFSLKPPFDTEGSLRAMHWGSSLLLRY